MRQNRRATGYATGIHGLAIPYKIQRISVLNSAIYLPALSEGLIC